MIKSDWINKRKIHIAYLLGMLPLKLYICHTFYKASWWFFFGQRIVIKEVEGCRGAPVPPRATWYKHDSFTHNDYCDVVRNASETSLTTSLVRFLPADSCCRLCSMSFTSCSCREGRQQGYTRQRETEMFQSKFENKEHTNCKEPTFICDHYNTPN